MIRVDSTVPLVTDRPAPPEWTSFKPALDLTEGDVIAYPFVNFDLLCRITNATERDGIIDINLTDDVSSFTHMVPATSSIRVYEAGRVGEVRR